MQAVPVQMPPIGETPELLMQREGFSRRCSHTLAGKEPPMSRRNASKNHTESARSTQSKFGGKMHLSDNVILCQPAIESEVSLPSENPPWLIAAAARAWLSIQTEEILCDSSDTLNAVRS